MEIQVSTAERVDIVDVTDRIDGALADATEAELCVVAVPHTTAGVVVNEAEPRLLSDLQAALERWVPRGRGYAHDDLDDNADAHLRTLLLGSSVTLPVGTESLALGTWQSVLFVECDGPRTRRLNVTPVPS